jgi:hypothetical protein
VVIDRIDNDSQVMLPNVSVTRADVTGGTSSAVAVAVPAAVEVHAPREIVFDDRPKQAGDSKEVQVVVGGQMFDEQLQALWLRRVQTKLADFLRAKFAYQLSRRQQETPQP